MVRTRSMASAKVTLGPRRGGLPTKYHSSVAPLVTYLLNVVGYKQSAALMSRAKLNEKIRKTYARKLLNWRGVGDRVLAMS